MRIIMKITCACGRRYEVDNFTQSRRKFQCPNCDRQTNSDTTEALMSILSYADSIEFSSSKDSSSITAMNISVLDD